MFRLADQMPLRARHERGAAIRYAAITALLSAGLFVLALPPAALAADSGVRVAQAQPVPQPPPPQYAAPQEAAPPQYAPIPPATAGDPMVGAIADGERDAVADTNGALWFIVGCAVGVLGVVLGYVVEPSPPPARLLGRSADYVATYTQSYHHAAKQQQGKRAMSGCLVGTLVTVAIYAAVLASAPAATTY